MLFQDYVEQSLLGSGSVSQAGIYSLEDYNTQGEKGFSVSPEQVKVLVDGMSDPVSIHDKMINIGDQQYQVVRCLQEQDIYGRQGDDPGVYDVGVYVYKTRQLFIIGTHADGIPAGYCANTVSKLADYLMSAGY